MAASIEAIGLVQPPQLVPAGDAQHYKIVCGYRRIQALKMLGRTEIPAGVFDSGTDPGALLCFALLENLSHRQFNPVEKAEAVSRLRTYFSDDEVMEKWLPLMGLHRSTRTLSDMDALARAESKVKQELLCGAITEKTAFRLSRMEPPVRQALLELLGRIRLSASKQAELIENTLDIARREGLPAETVLKRDELQRILAGEKLSPARKGDALRQCLGQWRYPRLSRRKKKFETYRKGLKLTKNILLIPPPGFEGDTYELRIAFDSTQSLREGCRRAEQLADLQPMRDLLEEAS